jgi:hypothetical protein
MTIARPIMSSEKSLSDVANGDCDKSESAPAVCADALVGKKRKLIRLPEKRIHHRVTEDTEIEL